MNIETYLRSLHDTKLPCQFCGYGIEWAQLVVWASSTGSGQLRHFSCPNCKMSLPQAEWRDYGVKRPFGGFILGLPGNEVPWLMGGNGPRPLWAIDK